VLVDQTNLSDEGHRCPETVQNLPKLLRKCSKISEDRIVLLAVHGLIGRLAVDRGYAGKGLGADLLADAPHRIAGASTTIGIAAVLVQAKDEAAKAWYLRQAESMAFPEDGRVLWLPVETVVGGGDGA
jgi:GNAT superfamily N-acetyltransferase